MLKVLSGRYTLRSAIRPRIVQTFTSRLMSSGSVGVMTKMKTQEIVYPRHKQAAAQVLPRTESKKPFGDVRVHGVSGTTPFSVKPKPPSATLGRHFSSLSSSKLGPGRSAMASAHLAHLSRRFMHTFELDRNWIIRRKFNETPAPFGFNGLGELAYRRTYSRPKDDGSQEEWWETVERVVNGTYEMQRQWIVSQGAGWDEAQAQDSAQEMYDRMWNLKFLPPGRGLWAQGSRITSNTKKLFAALNNCAFVSTEFLGKDEPSKPFCFLMDMSMLGVGVGFDCQGEGKVRVYGPNPSLGKSIYVAEDTREGWVECLRKKINSFLIPDQNTVEFDLSKIRPKGAPIRTFGGVASGPGPLLDMLNDIDKLLVANIGRMISMTLIVDIMNLIGVAVIAGNVRRTAEIALGPNTAKFIQLKDPKVNPQRAPWMWASNNSVFATIGQDYSEIAERIKINGEPGLFFLDNSRRFGRMGLPADNKDMRVKGTNPCVTGETMIFTTEGLRSVLSLVGKPFTAIVDGKKYPSTAAGFWKTGDKEVFEVTLANGMSVMATADHRFMTSNGKWTTVENLKIGTTALNISNNSNLNPDESWGSVGTFDEGYFCGLLSFKIFESGSREFSRGLLQGLFDKDGTVDASFVRLAQRSLYRLQSTQRMLLSFGILSTVSATQHELIIAGQHMTRFAESIGFSDETKQLKLGKIAGAYTNTYKTSSSWQSKVKAVKKGGVRPVFDATIPEISAFSANGFVAHNCGEQSLESYELCCLVETFIARHESLPDFLRTLKFAFLYAKTVTLGQTHWPETNRVLLRNRRIGCSLSGIVQFLGKGRNNTETLRQWLVAGYDEIQKYDEKYSEWFAIPQSRKTTSIKPSGTISLLAGATPGIHYPISRFYIRRVRVRPGPITQAYAEAGFPVEQDVVDPNSSVVEIPVDVGPVRTLPSMREQMDLAAMVQRWYADNSVSVTLTFDPKTEGHLIEPALNYAQYHFKSLSFLPSGGKVYAQMPYEKITEDEYKKRVSKLKPIIWTNLRREDRLVEKGCDGAACEIVPIPNTDSNAKAVEVVLPRSV